ncbi:malonyl-CoA decarboxylase [Novosphingobium album (ex Liu et al. 2023)]|uniref:Malonyl-CoA decarboxylase n=1 Tax=Novosphingobium album (ex Liu et al. 2023) TaxID=3031130 RepID=A0ABT5WUZ5_9SPHN|nr:malonyl-CoA decarboxylase [Novosphingobium album (ex Liu et al. 2023)]MDE8653731.1 malonyl-CoA decarboxylase [Novosphingobium album (ex Liu et al. 2023)]
MNTPRSRSQSDSQASPRRRNPLDLLMKSGLGKLLRGIGVTPRAASGDSLLDLADALLSLRGRASGPALASAFFDLYEASDTAARHEFLGKIHDLHPADAVAIDRAIAQWQEKRDENAARALNEATESPSQKLIRLLNLAPQGTERLIDMREDLLSAPKGSPGIAAFDREMESAFTAWFNAGFLELRRIGWDSPAHLLERIIRYEAVHEIHGWEDLRRRVEPTDRRCYGFFHPQMMDDPLIFVEVALTPQLPSAIHQIIAEEREHIPPTEANCAIFYSISNCQVGLKGIPFGNYLIKRVVGLLKGELPHLKTFATLSPVPGFARWLAKEQGAEAKVPGAKDLRMLAAQYLVTAKGRGGQPLDSVARFHLGNGARLEAIHANADLSENGQRQAHGVMVNYVYDLGEIEANHFALTELGTVATSKAVQALVEEAEGGKGGGKSGGRKDSPSKAAIAA